MLNHFRRSAFSRLLKQPLGTSSRTARTIGMSSAQEASSQQEEGPVTKHLREKLDDFFKPVHLEVECESRLHNVPKGSEIHFRTLIVSDKFNGLSQLQRQRMVNKVLAEELETCVHALRIEAKQPSEYSGEKQGPPPACGGGKGL